MRKWTDPDYTSQEQSGTSYPLNIDAALAIAKRFGNWFNVREVDEGSPAPDLAVFVDAGAIIVGGTLIEVSRQSVAGFTIPTSGQHRVDRVVLNPATGAASRVAGTAVAGSPSAVPPSIPSGYVPLASILITSSDTAVTTSMITDERAQMATRPKYHSESKVAPGSFGSPSNAVPFDIGAGAKRFTVMFDAISTTGTSPVIVQLGDAGGLEVTGYTGGAGTRGAEVANGVGAAVMQASTAANAFSGAVTFTLKDPATNTWAWHGVLANTTSGLVHGSAGSKSLSGELTSLLINTVDGTQQFDGGSVQVMVEFD